MGNGLGQGQTEIGSPDLALVKGTEAIGGQTGFGKVAQQAVERAFVVVYHLLQAEGQAAEGEFVAGKDEVIFPGESGEPARGGQPFL